MESLALSVAVFLPLVGAGIIMLVPKAKEEAAKPIALGVSLLAIGHPATASAEGGWLVTAGPFVRTEDRALWADLVAPTGGGGFFEGGMSGAPILDLQGEVVAFVCCQQPWGPQLSIANAEPAEVLLRRHVVVDERAWHGGTTASAVRAALAEQLAADP